MVLSAAAQTLPVPAAPAAAPVAVPAKIAVIAFQVAVAQTNEGQRDFADLQKKYAPKEAALKSLSDEIDNLTKQLQAQGASLSEAERNSRAKTIDDKKKQLDRDTEDARNDFQQDMQDVFNSLASKVYDVMQSYAEQQGYTLILDISQQQSPVLYAVKGTNITKQVIDAYNVKSGVPAPPAQPAAAAPKPAAPKPGITQARSAQARCSPLICNRNLTKAPPHSPGPLSMCRFLSALNIPVEKFVDFFRKPLGKSLFFPLVSRYSILIEDVTLLFINGNFPLRPIPLPDLPIPRPAAGSWTFPQSGMKIH